MTKKIRGQIIRILDTRTVIINLGLRDGITHASIFSILSEPEPVVDPFSPDGEVLGRVAVVKARVKTSQVYEKFTIATTKWFSQKMAYLWTIPGTEKMEVDEGELLVEATGVEPWKAKSEIPVQVGDFVEVTIPLPPTPPPPSDQTPAAGDEGGGDG